MHRTLLNLIEQSSRSNNNDNDDELDLSFASLAMCIRHNFTLTQREAIHMEILNLVNTAIANKEKGMPIITPRFQGFHTQAANRPPQQAAQGQTNGDTSSSPFSTDAGSTTNSDVELYYCGWTAVIWIF